MALCFQTLKGFQYFINLVCITSLKVFDTNLIGGRLRTSSLNHWPILS